MIQKNKRRVKKDLIKKCIYTKNEIKKILIKSIIQNKNISEKKKSFAVYKLSQFKANSSISKQNNNVCLMTGRYKGILKNTNFSRHFIKTLALSNDLQNFKIKNW